MIFCYIKNINNKIVMVRIQQISNYNGAVNKRLNNRKAYKII